MKVRELIAALEAYIASGDIAEDSEIQIQVWRLKGKDVIPFGAFEPSLSIGAKSPTNVGSALLTVSDHRFRWGI